MHWPQGVGRIFLAEPGGTPAGQHSLSKGREGGENGSG